MDTGTTIGLPYPYTVPCCEGHFQELYYWDTYFTNSGLLRTGQVGQARNNIDNMCFLINKFSFMPNGNLTYYLSRSQPPFLSQMVRELYDIQPDAAWLVGCYQALEKNTFSGKPSAVHHPASIDITVTLLCKKKLITVTLCATVFR